MKKILSFSSYMLIALGMILFGDITGENIFIICGTILIFVELFIQLYKLYKQL